MMLAHTRFKVPTKQSEKPSLRCSRSRDRTWKVGVTNPRSTFARLILYKANKEIWRHKHMSVCIQGERSTLQTGYRGRPSYNLFPFLYSKPRIPLLGSMTKNSYLCASKFLKSIQKTKHECTLLQLLIFPQ